MMHVDELNDECLPRHLLQVGDVGSLVGAGLPLALVHVLDHLLHRELLEGAADLCWRGLHRPHRHPRGQPQIVHNLQVHRVPERDSERPVIDGDRQRLTPQCELPRH